MKHLKIIVCAAFLSAILASCTMSEQARYEALSKAAAKEYLKPIRPFTDGRNPCWNGFCKKFTYAPVFDFQPVDGAVNYRYTVTMDKAGATYSFTAKEPCAALSPIWNEIPAGNVVLRVEGLDNAGNVVGLAGERAFLRDFPFEPPYVPNVRPYREAALMAMLYIQSMPQIRHWLESTTPDMSYKLNTYPNKIIGNTISLEALFAKAYPECADEAIKIAKNAAQFLIDQSRPEGDPLQFFPPSYYGGLIASAQEWNQGKVMTIDPCYAANGFLDLYDVTGEEFYKDRALKIADTYAKIQNEDGSFPIKLFFETGKPVNNACAMLHPILNFFSRLEIQYDIRDYSQLKEKAENWMKTVALETFDLTGQFEDVNVEDVQPYQNLTNSSAAPYASYILKGNPSAKDIEDARDLIRLSEDQFVHWNALPEQNGVRRMTGPCVFEQHRYQTPVDNSSCNVANAYLDLYQVTGDRLAFEKAKALVDALTVAQQVTNGCIPTSLDFRTDRERDLNRAYWLNCSVASIKIWLRMADITGEKDPRQ